MQEIKLDKHIKLLDCPGIVMARDEDSASLALKNCIKVENLEDPIAPIDLLIKRCNKEQLILRYKIAEFTDSIDFLTQVARRLGKMKKGGVADIRKAAQLILNDWTGGRLSYYTQPPKAESATDTKIVTKLAPAFDIDALFADNEEKEMFNSMDDTKILVDGMECESNAPTKVNFDEIDQQGGEEEDSDEYEDIEDDDDDDEDLELEKEEDSDEEEAAAAAPAKKVGTFKSDKHSLNKKVSNKIRRGEVVEQSEDKQTNNRASLKRKATHDSEDSDDIYQAENIPRTKKMQKMEMKRKVKKAKRSGNSERKKKSS
jgi:nuclear GTP-binding protein